MEKLEDLVIFLRSQNTWLPALINLLTLLTQIFLLSSTCFHFLLPQECVSLTHLSNLALVQYLPTWLPYFQLCIIFYDRREGSRCTEWVRTVKYHYVVTLQEWFWSLQCRLSQHALSCWFCSLGIPTPQ